MNDNIKVIPIGIKLPKINFEEIKRKKFKFLKKIKKNIYYFSRLHEKKV